MRLIPASMLSLALFIAMTSRSAAEEEGTHRLTVTSDFEGGSGTVLSIDQTRRAIRFSPTKHKDRGVEAWWYINVAGIQPGETITLELTGGSPGYEHWARPDQASFSLDGKVWTHTAPGDHEKTQTVYQQKINAAEAWFAWGPPWVPSDAQALVDRLAKQSPMVEAVELCRSAAARPVPALRISGDANRYGVFICARQHAWEVSSSWVCQGLMEWLLADDPRAQALREKVAFYIVPIMDVDNVAIGAGGKGEKPHDHNQDWANQPPHFLAVAAAQRVAKAMIHEGRLDLLLDIHGPLGNVRQPFFYAPHPKAVSEMQMANVKRFLAAARLEMVGPLALGKEWLREYTKGKVGRTATSWGCREMGQHGVSLTIEVAYNTPNGTIDGYTMLGQQLGQAIEIYFRTDPRVTQGADTKAPQ